jgi:hypothetical protein
VSAATTGQLVLDNVTVPVEGAVLAHVDAHFRWFLYSSAEFHQVREAVHAAVHEAVAAP